MTGMTLAFCLHVLPMKTPYRATVAKISCRVGVDPRLTEAIILTESKNNPHIIKKEWDGKRSYGLMQIKMETARMMGFHGSPKKLLSPWINIYYGTRYLKAQMRTFHFVWDAVSGYNAGHSLWRTQRLHYMNSRYVNRVAMNYYKLSGKKTHLTAEDIRIEKMLADQKDVIFLSYQENLHVNALNR